LNSGDRNVRLAAFGIGLLLLAPPVQAATVLSVGDGDTITITNGAQKTRVRLACIDAPETSQTPYGMESRQALQKLLPIGTEVTVRTKATDRYGRTVGEVLKGGTNINQSLVGSGNAFVYWQYISGCDRQTYSRLENDARLRKLGVWSVPNGIQRPWDYRRNRKGGSSASPSGSSSAGSGKYRCNEIGSWDKAQALLKQGHTYLDSDGDGEACETLR
jgi:endonuclease YncB( thermonuclease family)